MDGDMNGDDRRRTVPDRFRRYSKGPFVLGCANLKREALSTHQGSQGHKDAKTYLASQKERNASPASKSLQLLNRAAFEKLNLFKNAHAVAKKCRPISDFVWVNELDISKGVSTSETYRNVHSCKEFMVAICEVERKKIEQKLADAKFCTITSDGSMDVSVIENEIVYCHFAVKGVVYCFFLGLIECESGDAKGVYAAICKAMKFDTLPVEDFTKKLVAFAGDGASVNTGALNGVIALMQQDIGRHMVMIRCMSHRTELSFKEAMKNSTLFTKVNKLLDELFKFYHKSPKQRNGLKQVFEASKMDQLLPTRVGGTRWVSHTQLAVQNMLRSYKALVTHLEQVAITPSASSAQSKAKFLVNQLKDRDNMEYAHFLVDLLAVVCKLSLTLQKRETCVYQVHKEMKTTITNIKKFETRAGSEQRNFKDVNVSTKTLKGMTLVGGSSKPDDQRKSVVPKLVDVIGKRYEELDSGLLSATKIAEFSCWPLTQENETDFGEDHVTLVIDHYRQVLENQGVSISEIEAEWGILKENIYSNHKDVHSLTWKLVNSLYVAKCPNILAVVDLLLSLPAGSSECERGFSVMKNIKTDNRNRLRSTTMTLLMTIQMHSADISSFDPTEAIHHWYENKHRRPYFMNPRVKKSSTTTRSKTVAAAVIEEEANAN
ncbi:zinc finger protein 862-like [Lingula anatina]|uniref:Zinc finger protein 862-like n=1 Tax=Lingula anatina TaxID=7574 RepID=A0A1S3I8P3_LINAN|nr:zinc finger protein 862-like [Lingula anatina]|eukprot:XP_013394236.1 zinc finger protein 862-like [Lingula anatina]